MTKKSACKIIQITDTHLFADANAELFGVKCNQVFMRVVQKVREQELSGLDAIFLTGDLSQDDTAESYQVLAQAVAEFAVPVYWIPGNHDDLPVMSEVFESIENFHHVDTLSILNWDFIFLDSRNGSRPAGNLSAAELAKLQEKISLAPPSHSICVVMHHHPHKVETPLIDQYILQNADEFWPIIKDTAVKLIICGHVHGDYKFHHQGVSIESAPATCLQWQKGTSELRVEKKSGYKVYYFSEDTYSAEAKFI